MKKKRLTLPVGTDYSVYAWWDYCVHYRALDEEFQGNAYTEYGTRVEPAIQYAYSKVFNVEVDEGHFWTPAAGKEVCFAPPTHIFGGQEAEESIAWEQVPTASNGGRIA